MSPENREAAEYAAAAPELERAAQMDARTLEALNGSIAKWEAIVARTGEDDGASNCPLCKMFNDDQNPSAEEDCAGCPVAKKVGEPSCYGTPYSGFAHAKWRRETVRGEMSATDIEALDIEAAQHAQAELDFLKSLLPVTP